MFETSQRPVIILGNGARGADCAALLNLGVPVLTSWQAIDLVDNFHPTYFGRPGIYGQRCANKILANADMILSIGCRLSIWTVGYDFAPNARLIMVDVDEKEIVKYPQAEAVVTDAANFVDALCRKGNTGVRETEWFSQCSRWAIQYDWVESPTHDDANGHINSYRFMERLQTLLRPDEVITLDAGGACCSAQQVLRLKPPQRMMTSGGLGEMGCGLPAAIGASFATNKGEVLCIVGDGALMLNLQELQTIRHHNLPVKIMVFCNDGYAMIRRSQVVLGMDEFAVGEANGVSVPNFRYVAHAFNIDAADIRTWEDFERVMPWFMASKQPALVQVFIDPQQMFWPKLQPIRNADGTISSPKFDELSPEII